MTTDDPRKPSRRKPTRREVRHTTPADAHYSKLTRKAGSDPRRSASSSRPQRSQRPSANASSRRSASRAGASGRTGAGSRRGTESRPARSTRRDESRRTANYETLASGARSKVYGKREPRRNKPVSNLPSTLIGVAVVALFILGGVLFWTHRSVHVTVNGSNQKIRVNSTLERLYDKLDISTNPGNYVSVGGKVIEEGKGYAFSATVNGKQLSRKQLTAYRIHGGEQVEFGDGGDRTEKYEVTYREVQPKLIFQGGWGAVSFVKQWGKPGKQEVRTGTVSGETADGDWVEELKDCIVMTKNIQPADGQKLVALTFDDGPQTTYTEQCLNILAEHGAKATFFNLSSNETELPELAAKVAASGNQICSHTNQHLDLATLGQADLISEITSARDTIAQIAGVDTTIIRPPYGSFTQSSWLASQGTISASVIWNQDTLDWSLPGSDVIVQNALTDIVPGSIILMHDGGGPRDQGMEALPQIIDSLKEDGYTFVTLSELLASDPDVPAEVAAGNATMPDDAVWPTEIGEATTDVG